MTVKRRKKNPVDTTATVSAPLLELDGLQVLEDRKNNPYANWGRRDQPNRVEPIATPAFDVPFTLSRGEKIFTIGSCFARNIETKLMEMGFDVPVRSLFRSPEFASVNPGIINNFGTPSIFNEFSWALDPGNAYDVENNILPVAPGKYVDLHVIPSERPAPKDEVLKRRHAISQVTKAIKDCRVVIMTLGLVELWYDREQKLYLNATVMPSLVKKYPGRFSLRVLDFNSAKGYLDRALDLARTHCRIDQQVLLTVSPVPLATTFRPMDVIVANSYSKSLLRAVAEQICVERENVHYYPSYESVTYSDRVRAWQDDFVHPTDEIVALNVARMTAAFVPSARNDPPWAAEIEAGGVTAALARSSEFAAAQQEVGEPFFDRCKPHFASSPDLAYNAASAYLRWGLTEKAMAVLDQIPETWAPAKRSLLAGRIFARMEDYTRVISELAPLVAEGQRIDGAWLLLVTARAKAESFERGRETLMDWLRVSPKRAYQGLTALAAAVEDVSPANALTCYERAFALGAPQPVHALKYSELLVRQNRVKEMRDFLTTQKFDAYGYEKRRTALLDLA